jgi:hypothetical protein
MNHRSEGACLSDVRAQQSPHGRVVHTLPSLMARQRRATNSSVSRSLRLVLISARRSHSAARSRKYRGSFVRAIAQLPLLEWKHVLYSPITPSAKLCMILYTWRGTIQAPAFKGSRRYQQFLWVTLWKTGCNPAITLDQSGLPANRPGCVNIWPATEHGQGLGPSFRRKGAPEG